MSIKLENISKVYGAQYALKNVSIEINHGEVVGLLGPNGAGKSTLMKIITGYLPVTEGFVSVDGLNFEQHAELIKRKMGYLPENNGLYLDMYVREYLSYVASLYGIRKNIKAVLDQIIEQCGLVPEQNKKIEALSKGYRQRVGLAQALIHDPDVLILDEPTSGLDPNQLVEIRNLIKQVGIKKTVLLSTHIMQEVEAICDRVIIIDKGSVVADDLTKNLPNYLVANERIVLELDTAIDLEAIRVLKGVKSAKLIGLNSVEVEANGEVDLRQQLFEFAVQNKLNVRSMQKKEDSLEQIFQQLTSV